MAEPIRCACSRLNDPWRRYCGGCGTVLGTGCLCGFPNLEHDRFCGGCGVSTVQGRASSSDLRITSMPASMRARISEPVIPARSSMRTRISDPVTPERSVMPTPMRTRISEPVVPERSSINDMTIVRGPATPERSSIDEMTIVRRLHPSTIQDLRPAEQTASTQQIAMLCDSFAVDPNT